jgi:hypothetical protein
VSAPKLTVVPLPPASGCEDIADYLRTKTEQAANGEVVACLVAVEYADGSTGWRAIHATHTTPVKLVGELELIKLSLLQHEAERRERQ